MEPLDLVRSVYPNCRLVPIGVGAEARIYSFEVRGKSLVLKFRPKKPWRHPLLDLHLRKSRTATEVKALIRARDSGIKVPMVLAHLGVGLVMEKVKPIGRPRPGHTLEMLHETGIVHGDPTPGNFVGEYLIDFGLAEFTWEVEKRAEDLVVALRTWGEEVLEDYGIPSVVHRAREILRRGKFQPKDQKTRSSL